MNSVLDIHADDYGLSENSDKDILSLCKERKLNSISILPNLSIFNDAAKNISDINRTLETPVKISVHLNIMEGRSLSEKNSVPHLTDKNGLFNISWGKLFIYNYIPFFRKTIQKELETEIKNQTMKIADSGLLEKQSLRFDSHQHPHMIPIFFDALLNVVDNLKENGYQTEFIRNTYDPLQPYLAAKVFFKELSIANVIKCLILNHYARRNEKKLKKLNLPLQFMCGVFFSGKMDSRLEKLLPCFKTKAETKNKNIELLFHPGFMLESELTEEFTKSGFNEFHLSDNRKIEFSTVSGGNFSL